MKSYFESERYESSRKYFEDIFDDELKAEFAYLPTTAALMEKSCAHFSSHTALTDTKSSVTYKELYEHVAHRRALLDEAGIPAGGHVGVMCRNNFDAIEWFLAVTTSGRVLMMMPVSLNAQAIAGISVKFDYDAIIADSEFQPLTEGLKIHVIDAAKTSEASADAADINADTTAAIFFTGGTTGAPKGAVLTHGALMRGSRNGCLYKGNTLHKKSIMMLPLSHIFGSVMGFLSGLYAGDTLCTCPDVKSGIGLIPVFRPTTLVLVPGIVEIILGIASMKGAAFLGDLHMVLCGAAPVPPRLMSEFKKYGIEMLAGYGLTEGSNLTAGNYDTDVKPHSMGHIYPGQDYRVVDGELLIKGDNLMQGYYKDPEKTAEVLDSDGWLHTGDLVSFDDQGYITITGRKKNIILLPNGENVSPEEIEDLFYQSPMVRDCLVREDLKNGHAVLAIEILPVAQAFAGKTEQETEAALTALLQEINAQLPPYKRVAKLTVRTEDFKRTGAMKVSRLQQ